MKRNTFFLKFNEKYNKQIKTLISCMVEKVLCAGSWMVVVIVIAMFVYMYLAQNKDYIFCNENYNIKKYHRGKRN